MSRGAGEPARARDADQAPAPAQARSSSDHYPPPSPRFWATIRSEATAVKRGCNTGRCGAGGREPYLLPLRRRCAAQDCFAAIRVG
ncbi:unnamed protein product, partial [Iphiclides podalirius]